MPIAVPGMSRAPVTTESPIAYAAMNASCTMPSSPMPAILPASSCRGRIAESRISTTRDAFSSITPVATHTPYPKSWPYASSTAMKAIAGVLLAVGILRFERPHLDRGLVQHRIDLARIRAPGLERAPDPHPDERVADQLRQRGRDRVIPHQFVVDQRRIEPSAPHRCLGLLDVVPDHDPQLHTLSLGHVVELGRGPLDRDIVGSRDAEVEGGGDLVSERPQQDEHRQHRERDAGRDEEALVAQPHPEVPHRDQAPGAAVGRPRIVREAVVHALTTSRNSSASVGCTGPNRTTSPDARARSRTRCSSTSSASSSTAPSVLTSTSPTPGIDPYHSVGAAAHLHEEESPLAASPQLADRPLGHDASAVDQHDRVAQPFHELELMAREHHGHPVVRGLPTQHARQHVDPDRIEPRERLVEHEQVGLVHERRGQLHALLVAERERLDTIVRALGHAEHLDRLLGPTPRVGLGDPVQPRQVDELIEDPHLRIEAALLGHVAEATAYPSVDGLAAPAHRTGVGREHAEGDAHRGGLARPVRPDEPHDAPLGHGERDVVERDEVAERAAQTGQLEHADIIGTGTHASLGMRAANVGFER